MNFLDSLAQGFASLFWVLPPKPAPLQLPRWRNRFAPAKLLTLPNPMTYDDGTEAIPAGRFTLMCPPIKNQYMVWQQGQDALSKLIRSWQEAYQAAGSYAAYSQSLFEETGRTLRKTRKAKAGLHRANKALREEVRALKAELRQLKRNDWLEKAHEEYAKSNPENVWKEIDGEDFVGLDDSFETAVTDPDIVLPKTVSM